MTNEMRRGGGGKVLKVNHLLLKSERGLDGINQFTVYIWIILSSLVKITNLYEYFIYGIWIITYNNRFIDVDYFSYFKYKYKI